jgi:D-tyrosyl-tRNA(Tyr) deacylase
MKLVIQRVRRAEVRVEQREVGAISAGALVLVGVAGGDTQQDAAYLARKTAMLRIFADKDGRMNEAIDAVNGAYLVVSQFTLYGDCKKGNRPSYIDAAEPDEGKAGYEAYLAALKEFGHRVETGEYQAEMIVSSENDGPVTLILESRGRRIP